MTEDNYKKTDDPSTQKAGAGSKQTQSGQIVDLAEILSKLSSKRVQKSFALPLGPGTGIYYLPIFPILGLDNRVASFGNSSVSFSEGLTIEVEWNEDYRTDQSSLTVGQYAIDYDDGTIAYNSSSGALIIASISVSELIVELPDETIIEDVYGDITYYGYSIPGAIDKTNQAIWKIKKIDETSDMIVSWADGNANYDNIWDNRAALSYS